ncbi:uncharacterized protein G2W53_026602 [Senna tora]|uniref:Uncharacterized protein n=1 Tax=Senna tora TaxID=362788 RepID=A0A834THA0_9FABA|nr:uncharacterized protein G2W53_026602 [Senna tora]
MLPKFDPSLFHLGFFLSLPLCTGAPEPLSILVLPRTVFGVMAGYVGLFDPHNERLTDFDGEPPLSGERWGISFAVFGFATGLSSINFGERASCSKPFEGSTVVDPS